MNKKFLFGVSVFLLVLFINLNFVNALSISNNYTLTEDITEQVVVSGSDVVLNLNGHSIKASANGAVITSGSVKLTITGDGTIESTNSNGVVVSTGSNIVMNSGNIKSVEFGVLVLGGATFTMNGGTITTIDNCGMGGNGTNSDTYRDYTINFNGGTINGNIKSNGYVSCGIYHPNRGTVNMTGGVINSSNGAGIVQRAGILNVTGGTINAYGSSTGKVGDSRVVVSANAIVVDREANYPQIATLDTKISMVNPLILNGDAGSIKVLGSDEQIEVTGGVYSDEPEEELIPDGYNAYQVIEGDNKDKYVVVKEEDLVVESVSLASDKDSMDEEDVGLIEEAIKDKYDLVSYYDAGVIVVTPSGDVVDVIGEPEEAVEVKFTLPSSLPEVKIGYTRKYYVIRVHNGEVTVIDDVTVNEDGTISFKSDKFSTYALAYKDVEKTEVNSPATGDVTMKYIIFVLISLVGACLVNMFKKIYN